MLHVPVYMYKIFFDCNIARDFIHVQKIDCNSERDFIQVQKLTIVLHVTVHMFKQKKITIMLLASVNMIKKLAIIMNVICNACSKN